MDPEKIKQLIRQVAEGGLSVDDASAQLRKDASGSDSGTLLDIQVGATEGDHPTKSAAPVNINSPTRLLAREQGGSRIGRYRILKEHARGGMGRVLLAVDTSIGRKVALKELLADVRPGESDATGSTRSVGERFLREARVTGRLEHPNIVPVYEIGEGDEGYFYSMRFVAGRTLAQRLKVINQEESARSRLAKRLELLDAFHDVCNAVAYAHSKGVIHRDLKPSNIMLGEFGETVVLDWGLARVLDEEDASIVEASSPTDAGSSQLTLDGAVLGTPAYMPPEQARGDLEDVNELSDVYALGAVLYEILSGRPPYSGDNARSIVNKVVAEAPESLSEIDQSIPPELGVLCSRAMAREMAARIPSAVELAKEVKAFRDGKTLQSYDYSSVELLRRFLRRQWKLVAVVALALIAVSVIGALALQEVVNERNTAQTALQKAEDEETRRIAAELESKRNAEQILASRQASIERVQESLQGFDADLMLSDLFARVDAYGSVSEKMRIGNEERERNRALITAVLGYASQLQELARLQNIEGTRHNESGAKELKDLLSIQAALVKLAVFNTDFELARYLISSSNLSDAQIEKFTQRIQKNEEKLREWRAALIVACLDDARLGLRRDNRPEGAPTLQGYIEELSGFQDDQTVRMLGNELEQLSLRLRGGRAEGIVEFDMAQLLCKTLGNLQRPTAVVPVLADFLKRQTHTRLALEAVLALASTQHASGTKALVTEAQQRDFLFIETHREAFASAYIPGDAEPLVRGVLYFARKKYAKAIETLDGSTNSSASLYRSLCQIELDELDVARTTLDDMLTATPDDATLHVARARIDAADWDITHYNQAVELAPDSPRFRLERAQFCRHRHPQQAILDGQFLTETWPTRVEHWQVLGDAYRDRGLGEQALPVYLKAVEVDPDSADAWTFLGATHRNLNQIEDAYVALETAVRLDPDRSHAMAKLGEIEFFRGNYTRCIELTGEAVAKNPDEQDAWYYQALAYLRQMDGGTIRHDVFNARARNPVERANMEKAVVSLRGLVANSPGNFRGWAFLARTLTALGRDAEALEASNRAYKLTLFGANTVGMGVSYLLQSEWISEARQSLVAQPATREEFFDAAYIKAFDGYHSSDPTEQRRFLREALGALSGAEALIVDQADPKDRVSRPRVRLQIAAAMRRAEFFHAIEGVLAPLMEGEPDWIALPALALISEATTGLGLQYRKGSPLFLGTSDEDLAMLESEVDALTGTERKQLAEQLIDRGTELLREVAKGGVALSDAGSTTVTTELSEDPRRIAIKDMFVKNIASSTHEKMHPYTVVIIGGVTKKMQAERIGIKQFDVIHSIGGRVLKGHREVGSAIAAVSNAAEYEMVLKRYTRTENGQPVQKLDAEGKPMTDGRGNPVLEYEELTVMAKPGFLGITIDTGHLPHPMDR